MPLLPVPMPVADALVSRLGFITETWIKYFTNQTQEIVQAARVLTSKSLLDQSASIGTTPFDVTSVPAGIYRLAYYAQVVQAATVSSSLIVTFLWTNRGASLSLAGSAMTGNSLTTVSAGSMLIHVDQSSPISFSTTYASVGATPMKYDLHMTLERLAA